MMKLLAFLGLPLILGTSFIMAADEITLIGGSQTWLPYFETPEESGKTWTGIAPGVVQGTAQTFSYKVKYEILAKEKNQRTGAHEISSGEKSKPVCFIDSIIWQPQLKENFYVSEPLVVLKDQTIYRKNGFPGGKTPSFENIPKGAKIGTCAGYSYAELEPYFKSGDLIRKDYPLEGGCEIKLLENLDKKQVDFIYTSADVAGYLIKQKKFSQGKLSTLPSLNEGTPLSLICNKIDSSKIFIEKFNAKFKQMSKEVEKIRARYVSPL